MVILSESEESSRRLPGYPRLPVILRDTKCSEESSHRTLKTVSTANEKNSLKRGSFVLCSDTERDRAVMNSSAVCTHWLWPCHRGKRSFAWRLRMTPTSWVIAPMLAPSKDGHSERMRRIFPSYLGTVPKAAGKILRLVSLAQDDRNR